ncbi:SpoIIE family protein phosphatase [Pseudonocardia sp. K10HN5]|uniref:SpoIIE family protein phosphatase n=2 Tax=Pseudonocardia acidicola TaxID=2724939 RepID=A0ABX1SD50_9PSEU|nr:ATP-binding SpoIIE family protein phosphatase [Pseudonocardia acidicola]NMH99505.1 SpoIIE family protein phosphatase [Pseudonocardia acidicola]
MAWLALDDASAAGAARRATERLADRLGMPAARVAEVGLAVTEIATNVHRHAGAGALLLRSVRTGTAAALEVVAVDNGPGIPDLTAARRDGHSTAGTLGIGLGSIDRLADALDISSAPGRGTVLVARFEARRVAAPGSDSTGPDAAGITRALSGETVCGDAYAVRGDGPRMSLMVCDGSGHGPLAAAAAREAVRAFNDPGHPVSPEMAVRRIHRVLSGTRGAAVAVAELDAAAGLVHFAGVGNIAGAVVSGGDKRSMVSIGGVAGYRDPTIRTFRYSLPPGSVVVLHSDGVRARWAAAELGGVLGRSPLMIAATLLRDAGVRQDDACVLVGRARR